MRIQNLQVERFRSISKASVSLEDFTVLVGANNEGKSNILRALIMSMDALAGFSDASGTRYRLEPHRRHWLGQRQSNRRYSWEEDFPFGKRGSGTQKTFVSIDFVLDDDEIEKFTNRLGSQLNGVLPIKLSFDPTGFVEFSVVKQRIGPSLSKKAAEIATFVAENIAVEYVPAVRDAHSATRAVQSLVWSELNQLFDSNTRYKKAVETLRTLEDKKLKEISAAIEEPLRRFMPDIGSVEIAVSPDSFPGRHPTDEYRIKLDDGEMTALSMKGDGVQSLTTMALIRRAALERSKPFLLAVEEPEAHLHPEAIHALASVLGEISSEQQVIVSTHSPLLVNRLSIASNIIVADGQASAAESISQIRDCLGVRVGDDLHAAELSLLVEGPEDRRSLAAILPSQSAAIEQAISTGRLAIVELGGASKLSSELRRNADGLLRSIVLLDSDKAGNTAATFATDDGLLAIADLFQTFSPGKDEAEFEDLLSPPLYMAALNDYFGTSLTKIEPGANSGAGKAKWSDRLKMCLKSSGKPATKPRIAAAKAILVDQIELDPENALNSHGEELIKALVARIEIVLAK